MKHLVGQTSNGALVYTQLIGSQAGKRISRQPQLLSLAKEMFATMSLSSQEICIEYDMKRPIGYTHIVETTEKDTIFYGRLLKEDTYTRFVKNGKPIATRHLTVMLSKESENNYNMSDIWMGRPMPPLPGSSDETAESKPYWSNHAFVLDSQPLQLKTVTKVCPY